MSQMDYGSAPASTVQAERFNALFAARMGSPTVRGIWSAVYGEDWGDELDPNSYVTLTELGIMAAALGIGPGQTILDLGGGQGGPALWLARTTGVSVVGVDLSSVGVETANARAREAGIAERVRFQVGDLSATGLPDAAFDGGVSVDVLLFVPDLDAAAREIFRLLRPGARFAFTTWEERAPSEVVNLTLTARPDYRPAFAAAGFVIERYEEAPDWLRRQRAVFAGVIAAETELRAELGAAEAELMVRHARTRTWALDNSRRVIAVVRHP